MRRWLKDRIRRGLARFGYVVRSAGPGATLTGADLLHDLSVLLRDEKTPLLFDVGANVGQTIEDFLMAFDRPTIRAFEPSPASFEALRRTYQSRPDLVLENLALGDAEGATRFHVTAGDATNDSLLPPLWNAGGTVIDVPVTTVDAYCARHGLDRIDLLKVDTQGFDLHVLRGASGMLTAGRVRTFFVEVMCVPMYEGQPGLCDFVEFAGRFGYRLVGFYDHTYSGNTLWYFNACFMHGGGAR